MIHHQNDGDLLCRNCGMVAEERCIDYTCAEYRIFADDDKSSSKEHYGTATNIFLPNAHEIELDGIQSDDGNVRYMANCKMSLKSNLQYYFGDGVFPGSLYETASEIMLICGKPENRQGKQTPKDVRYNMYTSVLLSILVSDTTFGVGLDKTNVVSFVENVSHVTMKEPSLSKRIHLKFRHENMFRKKLEKKLNLNPNSSEEAKTRTVKSGKRLNMKWHADISLTNNFDLSKAVKNRERRLRFQHVILHRIQNKC